MEGGDEGRDGIGVGAVGDEACPGGNRYLALAMAHWDGVRHTYLLAMAHSLGVRH